jgi:hypothetical protein
MNGIVGVNASPVPNVAPGTNVNRSGTVKDAIGADNQIGLASGRGVNLGGQNQFAFLNLFVRVAFGFGNCRLQLRRRHRRTPLAHRKIILSAECTID